MAFQLHIYNEIYASPLVQYNIIKTNNTGFSIGHDCCKPFYHVIVFVQITVWPQLPCVPDAESQHMAIIMPSHTYQLRLVDLGDKTT